MVTIDCFWYYKYYWCDVRSASALSFGTIHYQVPTQQLLVVSMEIHGREAPGRLCKDWSCLACFGFALHIIVSTIGRM